MQKTVLVADDDRALVGLLKQSLSGKGYRVITAHDGRTAMDLIRLNTPDLAVLDIMMPDMDGITLGAEARSADAMCGMPVIIITGIGLLFPEILVRQFFGVSGLLITDVLHITVGFILSVFMAIHIYTCTLGEKPGTLFKSMINGYHEEHE